MVIINNVKIPTKLAIKVLSSVRVKNSLITDKHSTIINHTRVNK